MCLNRRTSGGTCVSESDVDFRDDSTRTCINEADVVQATDLLPLLCDLLMLVLALDLLVLLFEIHSHHLCLRYERADTPQVALHVWTDEQSEFHICSTPAQSRCYTYRLTYYSKG